MSDGCLGDRDSLKLSPIRDSLGDVSGTVFLDSGDDLCGAGTAALGRGQEAC